MKQLEEQLVLMDKSATGFVGLKQLRWLLLDHFGVETSETRLLEMCLGMNFNPQAQLDFKEFVTALLDILIYAAPNFAASKKNDALSRFDKYLESGFPPGRHAVRQLVEQLCRKYDLESDGRITLAEFLRVLRCDLMEEHALRLAFPLTEKETIQLILSTSTSPVGSSGNTSDATGAFVHYDQVLDELFGQIRSDEAHAGEREGRTEQALSWRFWERIRKTLCNGSRTKEASVLEQILKIVRKLDRSGTFTVSPLFFKRIFDQHLRSEDIYVLSRVLQVPESSDSKGPQQRNTLRYDVFLFMTFGSPRIEQDIRGKLPTAVALRSKLARNEQALRASIADVMKMKAADWRLDLESFCRLVGQSTEQQPLAAVEVLFLFSALSDPNESVACVEVKTLWSFLIRDCWDQSRPNSATGSSQPPQMSSRSNSDENRSRGDSIRGLVIKCLNNYNLERVLAPYKQKHQGWVATSKLAAELVQMFHAVGVSSRYKSEKEIIRDLEAFLNRISDHSDDSRTATSQEAPPFPGAISLHNFFERVFDWDTVIRAMQLPHNLVEVNRLLQVFDWDKNGMIQCDDWNKAWRQICLDRQGMHEWEVRVLQRRFPGTTASSASLKKEPMSGSRVPSLWGESINYSRLLVFLLDLQQQQTRDQLCKLAIDVIRKETTTATGELSTFRMEKLFQELDRDDKGYFNTRDLVAFLSQSHEHQTQDDATGSGNESVIEWLENADAVAFVMRFLSNGTSSKVLTDKNKESRDLSSQKALVVTFDQFRRLVRDLAPNVKRRRAHSATTSMSSPSSPSSRASSTVVASLRSLELALIEIARDVSQASGQVLPLRAFQYFSQIPPEQNSQAPTLSKSPLRSPKRDELSSPIKNRHRELQAAKLDPLTPERLKQVLHRRHHLTVSTHLVGQFFLHIGAASKHFLEPSEFSRWAAPLASDTLAKVRETVKKMIAKGKGGGGKVDLDRFLAQLERRLMDSPMYFSRANGSVESSVGDGGRPGLPSSVPVSLLLSKLHQLNIPLNRPDMTALLRHFGMGDDDGYVDYTLFLQRLYETSLAS